MPDQISERIKTQRAKIIRELAENNKLKYRQSFIGRHQTVLTEKVTQKMAKGYGQHYIPLEITGENLKANTFYKIVVTGIANNKERILEGRVIPL